MKTLLLMIALTFSLSGLAADRRQPAPAQRRPAAQAPQAAQKGAATKVKPPGEAPRKKEINFEERVLEGLSDRGYEQLNQTGNLDGAARDRLYRKRAEFDEESQYLLREMEYMK